MSIFSSYKKIFLLGFIIIILVAIPLSVYIAQQRQQTKSKASQSTTLSFEPASKEVSVGDILSLNIVLDPGTGATANQVSFVKLSISFDPAKFKTITDSLTPNEAGNTLKEIFDLPQYDNTAGKASISLSVGADPTSVITKATTIAILKLEAISETGATPSEIKLDDSQVLSIASSDGSSENVLSTTNPATITVASAAITATPALSPTPTAIPTTTPPATTLAPNPTAIPTALPSPPVTTITQNPASDIIIQPSLPPTGNGKIMFGLGTVGIIFTIIGGALLLL